MFENFFACNAPPRNSAAQLPKTFFCLVWKFTELRELIKLLGSKKGGNRCVWHSQREPGRLASRIHRNVLAVVSWLSSLKKPTNFMIQNDDTDDDQSLREKFTLHCCFICTLFKRLLLNAFTKRHLDCQSDSQTIRPIYQRLLIFLIFPIN